MTSEREWSAADYRRDANELAEELAADARAEARDAAEEWTGAGFDRPDPADVAWIEDEAKRIDREARDGG